MIDTSRLVTGLLEPSACHPITTAIIVFDAVCRPKGNIHE